MKLFHQFNVLPRYLTHLIMQVQILMKRQKSLRNALLSFKTFGRKNVENIQQIKIV